MKSLTSKFVLALLSLVLTGAALSVGVYAWFTINNRVSIDAFEGQVQGSSGLLISIDEGATWSGSISSSDIQDLIKDSAFSKFGELTSEDGITLTKRDGTTVAAAGEFITFDVWFAATKDVESIGVSELDIFNPSENDDPRPATTFPSELDGVILSEYASNAARVSIVDLGPVAETAVGFEKADKVDGNTLGIGIWADPADPYTEDTEGNYAVWYYNKVAALPGNSLTVIPEDDFTDAKESLMSTAERTTEGGGFDPEIVVVASTHTSLDLTDRPTEDYTKLFKVRVNVWIEGWDQEAFNAILNGVVGVSINFVGNMSEESE